MRVARGADIYNAIVSLGAGSSLAAEVYKAATSTFSGMFRREINRGKVGNSKLREIRKLDRYDGVRDDTMY